ncbi:MAG: helicase-associated domain-containing protein [Planctomycetota bacterium]|jgi:hypothetical protein
MPLLRNGKSALRASEFLRRQRRSDLQEHFLFWCPGEKAPRASKEIAGKLVAVYADPDSVKRGFDKLPASQRNFLRALVTEPGYTAPLSRIMKNAAGSKIPQYEMESVMKTLAAKGFIASGRTKAGPGGGAEFHAIVAEIGDILEKLCAADLVTHVVTSLEQFLKPFSRAKYELFIRRFLGAKAPRGARARPEVVARLAEPPSVQKRLKNISEREVRSFVRMSLNEYGGIMPLPSAVKREFSEEPEIRRKWKHLLEDNLLGTIGLLDLKEYGVDFEEEVLVVFSEIVSANLNTNKVKDEELETVAAMDLDFLRDLTAFLRHVKTRKVKLGGSGAFYREDAKIVLEHSCVSDSIDYSDDEVMNYIDATARGLSLIDHGHSVQLTQAGRMWEKLDLIDRMRALVELAREWRNEGGSDFHMRHLRPIVLEHLASLKPECWFRVKSIIKLTLNTYFMRLPEMNVAEQYGNYKFRRLRPGVKLRNRAHELQEDLFWWLKNRVFPLGIIELAYCEDEVVALRVSQMGERVFQRNGRHPKPARSLIVNPDFEVMLMPEGNYFDLMADLHEFAIKEKKDQITHFRITEHSIKEAVFHRFPAEEILQILEKHSKTPLPQNVEYSILDWGKSLAVVTMNEVALLEAESEEAFRKIKNVPAIKKLILREITDRVAVIRRVPDKKRLAKELKPLGVYLR